MDDDLLQLDDLGVTLAITADHGMKSKHDAEGRPNVICLQRLLDEWQEESKANVILPITDPYGPSRGIGGVSP
jgi:phosphonoacetate hydrolase